jgi:hypothetical protein
MRPHLLVTWLSRKEWKECEIEGRWEIGGFAESNHLYFRIAGLEVSFCPNLGKDVRSELEKVAERLRAQFRRTRPSTIKRSAEEALEAIRQTKMSHYAVAFDIPRGIGRSPDGKPS